MNKQPLQYIEKLATLNDEKSIPCREIFHNKNIQNLTYLRKLLWKGEKYGNSFDIPEFKDLPSICVNIEDIVTTQNVIYLSNLQSTKDVDNDTGAILVCKGGKYLIFDGHHRIANRILKGDQTIQAYVFCPIFILTNT